MEYHRPPADVRTYRQELLHDGDRLKITLLLLPPGSTPLKMGDAATLPVGSAVLWFTFPDAPYEVAACYDPAGDFAGYYTNLVRPPELGPGRWRITDLFLDVWQPPKGRPALEPGG